MSNSSFANVSLGDIADFRNGKAISPEKYTAGGKHPVFGSNGRIASSDEVLYPEPVVVIGRVGAYCGCVHYVPRASWVTDNAIVALPKDGNDIRYLFYLLGSLELQRTAIGSAQPLMTQGGLKVVRTKAPPLPEQKAIAAVLGALDDKIELNRRMNATLEAMARALFQSWFVDFDPVRAKAEGRSPAGLDESTAARFPAQFQDSELGPIPVGWTVASIDELAEINGWTLGKSDNLETLEYVEISEVSAGNIANVASYDRGTEPSRARRRLRNGDSVLSTVRPDRRSYFLALDPPTNRVVSTGFAVVTPTEAPWSFVHSALVRDEIFEQLGHLADGGAYPAVRPEVIGALKVAMPENPAILDAFHAVCGPLFEQAEANRRESRTLATLRDTLLPKLLCGTLQIRNLQSDITQKTPNYA